MLRCIFKNYKWQVQGNEPDTWNFLTGDLIKSLGRYKGSTQVQVVKQVLEKLKLLPREGLQE